MEEKQIIAQNIANLRIANELTQSELANIFNYSDKAVSKWERGESIPDVVVLLQIAKHFGVTLDYLVGNVHSVDEIKNGKDAPYKRVIKNHGFITGMAIILVWLIAGICFVVFHSVLPDNKLIYLTFLYASVASLVVWLIFNSIWFDKRKNYLIISLLMWVSLFAVQLSLLLVGINIWMLCFLGIPAQIIIYFWSRLKY